MTTIVKLKRWVRVVEEKTIAVEDDADEDAAIDAGFDSEEGWTELYSTVDDMDTTSL